METADKQLKIWLAVKDLTNVIDYNIMGKIHEPESYCWNWDLPLSMEHLMCIASVSVVAASARSLKSSCKSFQRAFFQ